MFTEKIDEYLSNQQQNMIQSLSALVAIPSVESAPLPGMPFGKNVRDALDRALELADSLGLETVNMDGYLGFADYGQGDSMLGILVHLDIVPEGPGWKTSPYTLMNKNGYLYGRGTQDDKGPAVAALYALAAVKAAAVPLKRKVRLLFGCDEESGWLDIEHYKQTQRLPDIAFSPDGEYPVVNSEKGILHLQLSRKLSRSSIKIHGGTRTNVIPNEIVAVIPIELSKARPIVEAFTAQTGYECICSGDQAIELTVKGISGHASTPELGKNALQGMLELLTRMPLSGEDASLICLLADRFAMDMHGETIGLDLSDELSGRLTLNPATIEWNGASVTITADIRHPLSLDYKDVQNTFASAFRPEFETSMLSRSAPHYVKPDSELVKKLLEVYTKRTGKAGYTIAIGGGSYARAIDNAVTFGCLFPAETGLMHMPDENIKLDDLLLNAKIMADAIVALAGE